MDTATISKTKVIVYVVLHKGTRAHPTREQSMDTDGQKLAIRNILICGYRNIKYFWALF